MTTEKIPLHDDQAWRRQLELNNKRLLENNRILAEKLNKIMETIRKEKETWAVQSIGWKAVESVENALK